MESSTNSVKSPGQSNILDEKLLYGNRYERFVRELITNSGVFWLFDLLQKSIMGGLLVYVQSLPHWIMLIASVCQSMVMTSSPPRRRQWLLNFIAPTLYTGIDMALEGASEFWSQPYHIFYWLWAGVMAFWYIIRPHHRHIATTGMSLSLVVLLPATYMFSEWESASVSPSAYWFANPAHTFILLASLLLGIILGISYIMQNRFELMLYSLAGHFAQVASWSFDSHLMNRSYENDEILRLHRIERTILFMDVRGFTPWSELHSPDQVVEMLNLFYQTAETVIRQCHGFKIQMSGDEIMTRFNFPQEGMEAALLLQEQIATILRPYALSAGIGLHTGIVIEGLVGGQETRQYGLFGDAVNTAARLQSKASSNEIVISQTTWARLPNKPQNLQLRTDKITLKGKQIPVDVYILSSGNESVSHQVQV